MTEQEYAANLCDSTKALANFICQGAKAILTPEDSCTADDIALNATVSACAHLIVATLPRQKDTQLIMCTSDDITTICAKIAAKIVDSAHGIAVIERKPKTK